MNPPINNHKPPPILQADTNKSSISPNIPVFNVKNKFNPCK